MAMLIVGMIAKPSVTTASGAAPASNGLGAKLFTVGSAPVGPHARRGHKGT